MTQLNDNSGKSFIRDQDISPSAHHERRNCVLPDHLIKPLQVLEASGADEHFGRSPDTICGALVQRYIQQNVSVDQLSQVLNESVHPASKHASISRATHSTTPRPLSIQEAGFRGSVEGVLQSFLPLALPCSSISGTAALLGLLEVSVKPGERFGLHLTIKLVAARVKTATIALGSTSPLEGLSNLGVRPFHLGQGVERVLDAIKY